MTLLKSILSAWTWKMAWRDSRRSRRKLLIYSSSIVLGIAALVAIGSLGDNLERSIEEQSKGLLGADLVIGSRAALTQEKEAFLESIGGVRSRELSFASMILFPKSGATRLVQVRAMDAGYPFYGELETAPASAASAFRSVSGALVEGSLLQQFDGAVGDPIKLGATTFTVIGTLLKVPGETVAFGTIAPRVFISLADLEGTGLLREESLVRHRIYFKFAPGTDVPALVERIRPQLEEHGLSASTAEQRQENLGRAMTNLHQFLGLLGFVALLLGGIGVASAIHVHVKQKLPTVAVLRCVGCGSGQAMAIYLAQAIALGAAGAAAGAALGLAIQQQLPAVLADFLPVQLSVTISWRAVARGAALGFGICVLFACLPLLTVRRVPPLAALRSSFEEQPGIRRDPWQWFFYGLIAASLIGFSLIQTQRWSHGLAFALGIVMVIGLLAGIARLLTFLLKKCLPRFGPFVWRQGVANLHRPNNRTSLLLLSLGLGTFLIVTLHLLQANLVRQLASGHKGQQPNAVLFDIQSDQKAAVEQLLADHGLMVLQQAPIVTMRLASIKGRSTEELRNDPQLTIPRWALRREYRSTYRDALEDSEELAGGQWHERVDSSASPVPISLEEGIATNLNVGLGDLLVFDVQGIEIETVVASLRKVDWARLQPNFFVVFPLGVLEEAPAFHVLVTHVSSSEESARMQRAVVQQFPNVSAVDLTLVLQTVDALLEKISFVIRFMALFTAGTGLLVLAGSVMTGRYQRLQESILLRTLGASRRQIWQILLTEYGCLGALAAMTGLGLAIAASWALSMFVFKVGFGLTVVPLVATLAAVCGLTILTGLLSSRGIGSYPPLEILRKEA
jgi:putative ABC transport system permease protein